MKTRLLNDDGGETKTEKGNEIADMVYNALTPIVKKAVAEGLSLRDLTSIVLDEITCSTAEELIRCGLHERRKAREEKLLKQQRLAYWENFSKTAP